MASKLRISRESQKAYWEDKLNKRKEELTGLGIEGAKIEKDTIVKKLKAKVRESTFRITAIGAREKKLEDMARTREEKKAAPPKEKGKKAEAAPVEDTKSKKKKKKEEGGGEAVKKEPKKKAEAPAS
jgi:hypothetical protein